MGAVENRPPLAFYVDCSSEMFDSFAFQSEGVGEYSGLSRETSEICDRISKCGAALWRRTTEIVEKGPPSYVASLGSNFGEKGNSGTPAGLSEKKLYFAVVE